MTTSDRPLRRPAGRYDEPRPLSRPVLLGLGVLLVVALAGLSFFAYRHYADARTPFQNTGYRVVSDTSVEVQFSVSKERGDTVQCQLAARDADQTEVGSLLVTLGPDEAGTVDRTETVTTTARAALGEVLSCRPAP
jgi:hypothetical protein